ncbi:M50 family metallopeptidase [Psychromicrobium lacuslunae]|uniref:Zinc metalloprotease n=1 Tax=Psychromicrobium lacuslunae TaxID=1618207 RepID=A0A0D4BW54_9MICC|nr:site-2 protease family protein [Psychromicrobium lacuslunae]AJT40533.1 zinc metalloprotease [Psychromicrobium lacuslunae]
MTVLLFILGVLFVVFAVGISIALHEVGHLVPAKLFKVRVTRYMIGFGPTLWSKKKGETEYGIKAIPAGGYVAMIGMYPPNKEDGSVRPSSTGMFQTLAESGAAQRVSRQRKSGRFEQLATDARAMAHEEVGPEDENRVFYKLPVWKKIIIMLGGPFMNLLIGTVLMGVLLMGFGTAQATTTLAVVNACQIKEGEATPDPKNCTPTPAAAAKLLPGDTITSFDGKQVTGWDELTSWIRSSAGKSVQLTVQRNGKAVQLNITPVLTARPVLTAAGTPEKDAAGKVLTQDVGFIGVSPSSENVQQPITAVLPTVGNNIAQVAGVVVNLPQRLVAVAQAAFSSAPRDPNGPVSVVGVGRVAGQVAAMEDVPLSARFATLLGLMAGLNFALFVFNLIPLLPLDGGHVAGALYEAVRRRLAKLFKRKDPGPFDIAKLLPLTYVVASVLLVMGALLIYADIVKPVNLFG